MWFVASACITAQMLCNLDHRNYNIKKFYDWLDVNFMTPISIKLCVLDACMFAAYLYGCECWSTIDHVKDKLLALERKLLKVILQVKPSTPNAIVYTELGRCDLIARIKSRQRNFFQKCKELSKEESIIADILELCQGLDIIKYYEELDDDLDVQSRDQMKHEIKTATTTQCQRYNELTDLTNVDAVYNRFLREDKRIQLTKWRLSSHDLHIERGRYTSPITPRHERTCETCPNAIENEEHVLFHCPRYDVVRMRNRDLFLRSNTVHAMLNPKNIDDANMVGDVLLQIDRIRKIELS